MLHGANQPLTPVNRYSNPRWLDNIPQILYMSRFGLRKSIFDVTPQVFNWIKTRRLGWPLHNFDSVGLEARCCLLACLLTGVFGVVRLVQTPIARAFPLQHKATWSSIFDICKLNHERLYAKTRPETTIRETSPWHDAWAIMLQSSECTAAWIQCFRVVWQSAALGPKNNIFTFISPKNVTLFLFGPVDVFFGKFYPLQHVFF